MNAVITAGGPIDGAFARAAGVDRKALAPVRGRTMLTRAIETLRACGIERIAVVGNPDVARACGASVETVVPDTGSGRGNVLGALGAWPDDAPLLYLTSDLPYLDAPSLDWFLQRIAPDAVSMPLCEHADYVRRFPGAPSAGIVLGRERVVNGGAFYLPAGSRARVRGLAVTMFDARKAPWRMAGVAGAQILLRFALGLARIDALEARARRVLGIPAFALRGAPPELAFDADTHDDYLYALAHE